LRRYLPRLRQPGTEPDPSAKVPDSDSTGAPPLHVRALDAFEAFYRQLGMVSKRIAELRAAFDTKPIASVVLTAADLNSALSILYARLELLEAVTNDDAGRDLWTLPMMEVMRSQLRTLLQDGTAYASRHPEGWRVVQQLHHLAVTLAAETKIAKQVASSAHAPDAHSGDGPAGEIIGDHLEPRQRVMVILDPSRPRTRCRMRRPWRRPGLQG
jgi:hypothetical protein